MAAQPEHIDHEDGPKTRAALAALRARGGGMPPTPAVFAPLPREAWRPATSRRRPDLLERAKQVWMAAIAFRTEGMAEEEAVAAHDEAHGSPYLACLAGYVHGLVVGSGRYQEALERVDDLERRLANAEIELGRLRARPRPWWRRGGA